MIRQIHIENYKALRDVTLDLTPFHVLIGPNDSGKTSILEAVGAVCRAVDSEKVFGGQWQGRDLVWTGDPSGRVRIRADVKNGKTEFAYSIECKFSPQGDQEDLARGYQILPDGKPLRWNSGAPPLPGSGTREASAMLQRTLHGVRYHRFDPRRLAMAVGRESGKEFELDRSGFGLALCLDDIRDSNFDRYFELQERFKRIFPQIKQIQFRTVSAFTADPGTRTPQGQSPRETLGKELLIQFTNSSTPVPAAQVSEGILLVLGYLTLLSLPQPASVILIEEPETGIYPSLLRGVIKILRDLVNGQALTQVIMTTHAPYVLDEFTPEEVTLCRKDADGSISLHPVSDMKEVKDRLDVFSLGELWTGEIDAVAIPKTPVGEPVQ
jgi:predicted ATPase